MWTGVSENRETTVTAKYVDTENGVVTLNWTHKVEYEEVDKHAVRNGTAKVGYMDVPTYDVHAYVHNKEKMVTEVLKVPMAKLADVDRKWVEYTDPDGTCLKKGQRNGTVGTLTPHFGAYQLEKKVDDDNAVVSYVQEGKTQWTFLLHSTFVRDLEVGKSYRSIPEVPRTPANMPADFKHVAAKSS